MGRRGEDVVAELLRQRGFVILERNARVGRLELDIVARRGDLVVVCEVRARTKVGSIHPAATIDAKKLERVRRGAGRWLRKHRLGRVEVRIDAATVVFENFSPADGPRVEYYENVSYPMRSVR